jgi:predicted phage tail protein
MDTNHNVTVSFIRNPFDPLVSRELRAFEPGRVPLEYLREFLPFAPEDFQYVLSINGQILDETGKSARIIEPGDSLVICPVPKGGGGDGKSVIGMVAMLAVVVAAAWVSAGALAPLLGTAFEAGAMGAMIAGAVIGAVGGMIVNALFPPATADLGSVSLGGSGFGSSPTYSWENEGNAIAEGVALPVGYGKFRVTPPLISKHVETDGDNHYLNLLYAVTDHALDSISGVEVNGNPVEYFEGVNIEKRLGVIDQGPIQFFEDTRADVSVQAKLSTDWVTRITQGNGVEGLGIGITLPGGLYYAASDGSLAAQTVKIEAEYREVGAETWTRLQTYNVDDITVTEHRWSAGYFAEIVPGGWSIWAEIEAGSNNPADHKDYEKYTPPAGNWPTPNKVGYCWRWIEGETVKEVGTVKVDRVDITEATQSAIRRTFYRENLPTGQYEVRVRLAEETPTGSRYGNTVYWDYLQEVVYDDFEHPGTSLLGLRALATDSLSGGRPTVTCLFERLTVPVWTGAAWETRPANNPAWVCYDMLVNDAYGGAVDPERIILSSFESWADWCDEQGYTVNIYIDSTMEFRRALNMVSVLGRGTVIQIGSRFTCLVDRPWTGLPSQKFLFSMGNIVKHSFEEEFLAMDDRANAIEVTYFDAELNYSRQTVDILAHDYDSTTTPINRTQVTLFGCDNRTEAIKYGTFLMLQNRYITLTASWTASNDAVGCMPGDVVDVQHDVPRWGYGGRIVSATTNTVTLDREVTMQTGVDYLLTVKHSNDYREYISIINPGIETTTDTITLAAPWRYNPPRKFDVYSFGEVNKVTKSFRVASITRGGENKRKIRAYEYVPEVYTGTAANIVVENPSDLAKVSNLAAREIWTPSASGGRSVVELTWRGFSLSWSIYVRPQGGAWSRVGTVGRPNFIVEFPYVLNKTYEFAVASSGGGPDSGQTAGVTILGKMAPPSDVTGFSAWQRGEQILFAWDHIDDADAWGYEIRRGDTWETGLIVVDGEQKNESGWYPPLSGTYTFWIKALDESGVYSANPGNVTLSVSVGGTLNIFHDREEVPAGVSGATLESLTYDATNTEIDWTPVAGENGVYTSQVYDLGAVDNIGIRMEAEIRSTASGDITDQTYPNRTDQTYPDDTDVLITSDSSYLPEFRTSIDNVTWSDWETWIGAVDRQARYFQLRVTTVVDAGCSDFSFMSIRSVLDVPDKDLRVLDLAVAAGGTTFALASLGVTFLQEYHVGVTVLASAARTSTVIKTNTDFTVYLYDAAGTAVSGNVDLHLRGY